MDEYFAWRLMDVNCRLCVLFINFFFAVVMPFMFYYLCLFFSSNVFICIRRPSN